MDTKAIATLMGWVILGILSAIIAGALIGCATSEARFERGHKKATAALEALETGDREVLKAVDPEILGALVAIQQWFTKQALLELIENEGHEPVEAKPDFKRDPLEEQQGL